MTCVLHKDPNPSLHVSPKPEGGVLLKCFGCGEHFSYGAVLKHVGLGQERQETNGAAAQAAWDLDWVHDGHTAYRYDDERGQRVYRVVRTPGKKFYQQHWEPGKSTYRRGRAGTTALPYRLPRWYHEPATRIIFWVEGEKDVHTLESMGELGTTSSGGCNGYEEDTAAWFTGRRVVILPDNDDVGRAYAAKVLASLKRHEAEAAIVPLPVEGDAEDVTDWVRCYGGSREKLLELAQAALAAAQTSSAFSASFAFPAFFAGEAHVSAHPGELEAEAFYGLTGQVIQTLAPTTEAAPAGLLASFLVGMGCLIGRGPFIMDGGSRHGSNLFACLVGPTGRGRKGTATSLTDHLLSMVDAKFAEISHSGLSTGEGLVHHVRDPRRELKPVLKSGRPTGDHDEVLVDQGASDKRAYIREEEFASVLKLMTREGNILSNVIRGAWDNRKLGNLTKNSRETATGAHVSIIAHVTEIDLRRYLTDEDASNGFANRFLWFAVERSQILPRGSKPAALAPLTHEIHAALEFARAEREFDFSEAALTLWNLVYQPLGEEGPGLFGLVTSRAEPQVMRLALLYAALDFEAEIGVPHLMAALAVWDYCHRSARFVFGEATGDAMADRIEESLRAEGGGVPRTRISDLFSRHARAGEIGRALALLRDLERARVETRGGTGGRPQEVWYAVPIEQRETRPTPLELARRHADT